MASHFTGKPYFAICCGREIRGFGICRLQLSAFDAALNLRHLPRRGGKRTDAIARAAQECWVQASGQPLALARLKKRYQIRASPSETPRSNETLGSQFDILMFPVAE